MDRLEALVDDEGATAARQPRANPALRHLPRADPALVEATAKKELLRAARVGRVSSRHDAVGALGFLEDASLVRRQLVILLLVRGLAGQRGVRAASLAALAHHDAPLVYVREATCQLCVLLLHECVGNLIVGCVRLERSDHTTANFGATPRVKGFLDASHLGQPLRVVMRHPRRQIALRSDLR